VGDVVVYGGRGGGEHRFGHGIYAGSLGLDVSDSYCKGISVRAIKPYPSEAWKLPGSLTPMLLGTRGTYLRIG
jgi:hypothetical protein